MKHINKSLRIIILVLISAFSTMSKAQVVDGDSITVTNARNIPYGIQPSWMVNGAMNTVEGTDILSSFTFNTGKNLAGRIPGLTVLSSSSEPGNDNPAIYIRGRNTFGTGQGVLVIVDGVESAYENLVPQEIQSISVLKDAAALAIYGSRGANGVLLVTTKKGSAGPMKINFGVQQGFSSALRLPEFLGAADFATLYNEALVNIGSQPLYSASDIEAYGNGSDEFYHPDVDWYDQILRNSTPVSNYNLNFSGGSSNARYFVLLNVARDNGLYKRTEDRSDLTVNQGYSRFNFRSNLDVDITKNFNFKFLLGGQIANKRNPKDNDTGSMFELLSQIPPNAFPIYNPNGTYGSSSLYSNPVGDALLTGMFTSNTRTVQIISTVTQKLDNVTPGLNVSVTGSFNNYFQSTFNKSKDYERFSISKDVNGNTIYNAIGQTTSLSSSNSAEAHWRNYEWNASLNYSRKFGANDVDGFVMYSEFTGAEADVAVPYRNNSLRGRLTLANSKKYIGEVVFNYNGTENFPKESRWGFFPAASLGWVASNESFLDGSSTINYLKIRGSYGLVGNDAIGGTRFMFNPQAYVSVSGYPLGTTNSNISSIAEGMIRNGDVTWEKETKWNIGFETTLFNQVEVSFDVFKNDRRDILAKPYRTVPSFLGLGTLPDFNIGKTTNKGFEAIVTYNSKKSAFEYFVTASAWYARNKIVHNGEAYQEYEHLYRTGHRIGQPFLFIADGFYNTTDITEGPYPIFDKVYPGDLKYKDQTGDNVIDQNDVFASGYSNLPEISAGLESGIRYRGFDLNVFFQGVTNRSVYLSGYYYQAFQNNGKVSSAALGRWTSEANASTATYPRLTASNNLNNFQSSSFWQRDGSYIKLRSIELGYNLPENLINRIKFDGARLYINGTNLFSWDHMDFIDPEVMTGYPSVRTYSIGAKFQF